MSRDIRYDVGGTTVVAICQHCGWRGIAETREQIRASAESHVIAVHPGQPRERTYDNARQRRNHAA